MGPVRQNPIQRTVRTAHLRVLMTVHNFQYTIQHRTVLIISRLTSRQITIAQMLSIRGKGGDGPWNTGAVYRAWSVFCRYSETLDSMWDSCHLLTTAHYCALCITTLYVLLAGTRRRGSTSDRMMTMWSLFSWRSCVQCNHFIDPLTHSLTHIRTAYTKCSLSTALCSLCQSSIAASLCAQVSAWSTVTTSWHSVTSHWL